MLISNLYEEQEHDYPGVRSKNLLVLSGVMTTEGDQDGKHKQESRLSIIKKGDGFEFWVEPNPLGNVFGKRRPVAVFSKSKMVQMTSRNKKRDVVERFKTQSIELMRAVFHNAFKPAFKDQVEGKEIVLKHSVIYIDETEIELTVWIDNYGKGENSVSLFIEATYSTYDPHGSAKNNFLTTTWSFPLVADYYEEMRDFLGAHHGRIRRHDREDKQEEYVGAARSSEMIKSAQDYINQYKQKKRGWL